MNFKKKLQKAFFLSLNRKGKKFGQRLGAKLGRESGKSYSKAKEKFYNTELGKKYLSFDSWLSS